MKAKLTLIVFLVHVVISSAVYADEIVAINVALAVRGVLEERVKSINNELKANNESSFIFDSEHLPHLTVFQFYTNKKQLDFFINGLAVEKLHGFKLKIKDFETSSLEKDSSMNLMNLVFYKDEKLSNLQRIVAFKSSLSRVNPGTKSAFLDSEVDQQLIKYVGEYADKKTGVNYSPHITLGIVKRWNRDNPPVKPNDEFIFDEIIISQMGNYGTVRNVIKTIKLDALNLK